ncbi:Hypothetical_protein [Hexamita inflata]|uniref:Hypothetical_protein n=1 Tax=Hexamita inflata TaxID=28002 RepID=A0AA86NVQ8_9EUKA|nr:Hypothetical protein HINF_LOCUS13958 [Hexamita inflata]
MMYYMSEEPEQQIQLKFINQNQNQLFRTVLKFFYSGHDHGCHKFSLITDFCKQHGMYDWVLVGNKKVIRNYIPGYDIRAPEAKGIIGMTITASKQAKIKSEYEEVIEEVAEKAKK